MLDVLAPSARLAVVRAGVTAGFGQPRLDDRFLLLALAEGKPLAHPVELGVTAASIRPQRTCRQSSPVSWSE